MASQIQFFQNSWHFFALVFCLAVLAFCWQIEAGGNGKEELLVGKVKSQQNASERQDGGVLYSTINKLYADLEPSLDKLPRNYLTVVLNASGVLGLGFLWIKEITNAIGTPILAPILMPPLMVLSAALLLVPDLSRLGELIDRNWYN